MPPSQILSQMITIRYNYTSGIVGCVNRPMRQQNHNSCNKHGVISVGTKGLLRELVRYCNYSKLFSNRTKNPLSIRQIWKLLDKTNTLPFYIWPQETIKNTIRTINYPFDWRRKCDIWKSFQNMHVTNIIKISWSWICRLHKWFFGLVTNPSMGKVVQKLLIRVGAYRYRAI